MIGRTKRRWAVTGKAALMLGLATGAQAETGPAAVPPLLFAQAAMPSADLPPPPPPSYAPLPAGRFLDPARTGAATGKTGFHAIDKSRSVGSDNRPGTTEKRLTRSKIEQHRSSPAANRLKKSH